jgi:CHAT domain-containing protein
MLDLGGGTMLRAPLTALGALGLLLLFVVDAPPEPAPPEESRLAERDRLVERVAPLSGAGKIAEAIEVLRRVLALEEEVFGAVHEETAGTHFWIATLEADRGDLEAALRAGKRVLAIRRKLHGPEHWRVADTRADVDLLPRRARFTPEERELERKVLELRRRIAERMERRRLREAIALQREVLAILERLYGPKEPCVAHALVDLADSLDMLGGSTEEEEALCRRAVEIFRARVGDGNPSTARALNALGNALCASAAPLRAEPVYREALRVLRAAHGARSLRVAAAQCNLASFLAQQDEPEKALPLQREAAEIVREVRGPDHPEYGVVLCLLANTYADLGEFDEAEPRFEESIRVLREAVGVQSDLYGRAIHSLGTMYANLGEPETALPLLREALEIKRRAHGPRSPTFAATLDVIGELLDEIGRTVEAEAAHREALGILRESLGENHPDTARSWLSLGDLHHGRGDAAQAVECYLKALRIRLAAYGKEDPRTVALWRKLGMVHLHHGEFPVAKVFLLKALKTQMRLYGLEDPRTAKTLRWVGLLCEEEGDLEEAEQCLRAALAVLEKEYGEDSSWVASVRGELALFQLRHARFPEAVALADRRRAAIERLFPANHPEVAGSLRLQVFAQLAAGEIEAARPLLERLLTADREHLDEVASVQSERQRLLMRQEFRLGLDLRLELDERRGADPAETYRDLLTWKGSLLARALREREVRSDPDLAPLVRRLESLRSRVGALLLRGVRGGEEGWKRIERLSREAEEVERELARRGAGRLAGRAGRVPVEALRKALPEGVVLLDFIAYRRTGVLRSEGRRELSHAHHLAAFVVRRDRPIRRVELGPARPIEDIIRAWRRSVRNGGRPVAGAKLRALLWEPVAPLVDGATCVLVSPDGALCRLPFGALPGAKDGTYLLEEVAVAVVPVPQVLPELLSRAPGSDGADSLLAIGDVDYGEAPETPRPGPRGPASFAALEATRAEVEAVRSCFEKRFEEGRARVLGGSGATEEMLRRQAPHHHWLHLATHGFFAPENVRSATSSMMKAGGFLDLADRGPGGHHPGVLSGLALAGANAGRSEDEDGILTALEVSSMDLSGVEMVVLSACETGLGEVAGGEGVLGLQRAFQVAGARTTVTSLWKVPDRATSELMRRMYENLWTKGLSRVEALRRAQLSLLREERGEAGDPKRGVELPEEDPAVGRGPSPYSWAAFVLSGDWR